MISIIKSPKRLFYLVMLSSFALYSCHNSHDGRSVTTNSNDSSLELLVSHTVGDKLDMFFDKPLPTFFNVGALYTQRDTMYTFILGSSKKSGQRVKTIPVAQFSFDKESENISLLVSMLKDETYWQELDYYRFSTEYHDLKLALEYWIKSQCPMNICGNYQWDNPQSLLHHMDNLLQNPS